MTTQRVNRTIVEGTPVEIGGEIFDRFAQPALSPILNNLGHIDKGRCYLGFFVAVVGSMIADFGKESALSLLDAMVTKAINDIESLEEGTRLQ